jgi:hypothetical protein
MRIRWTTRIAMAVGVITLIAGVAAGGGPASAASAGAHVTRSQAAGYGPGR